MEFPHLEGATAYPWNTEPAPYKQFPNTFDYSQWTANARIKLLNVPWDGRANIVKWVDDEARDQWFTDTDGYETVLETPARMNGRSVKIPLPYDMSALYNYLWLEMPALPVSDGTAGVKHWGFFMTGMEYHAASTTELLLDVDWLTTFMNCLEIPRVQLAQGHWAVANSADVDTFLADPLNNTTNLMDDEGDALSDGRQTRLKPIDGWWNRGDQSAVLNIGIVDADAEDWTGALPTIGTAYSTTNSAPTGYMLALPDVTQLDTFLTNAPTGLLLNIQSVWIIPKRYLVFGDTQELYSATVARLLATQDVPENVSLSLEDFNYPASAENFTKLYTGQYARVLLRRNDGATMSLPTEAISSKLAVHSRPEVTDSGARILAYLVGVNDATINTIGVKRLDTGGTEATTGGAWAATLQSFNIPAYRVQVDAVSATAWSKQYERDNANARAKAEYDNSCDSADNTYTVNTASASTGQSNANASADNAYSTAKASADTSQTNTNASADNAYSTTTASASTAQTNAGASADTAKANTTRDTDNAVANTALSVSTSKANQTLSNELSEDTTNLAIAAANESSWINIDTQIARLGVQGVTRDNYSDLGSIHGTDVPKGSSVENMLTNAQLDQTYTNTQYSVQREAQADGVATTALTNAVAGFSGVTSTTVGARLGQDTAIDNGMSSGMAGAVSAVSAGLAVLSVGAGLAAGVMQLNVSISKEQALQDASRIYQIGDGAALGDAGKIGTAMDNLLYQNQQERILARKLQTQSTTVAKAQLDGGTTLSQTVRHGTLSTATSINTNVNALSTNTAANNKSTADSNATATQTTSKANAQRTYDTTVSNAAAVQTTSKANATRTHDTTVSNAAASQTTTKANAQRTYDTSVSNAEKSRDVAKANALRTYNAALATTTAGINSDARLQPITACAGDATADPWTISPVGIELLVERPTDGDLLRIADRMNAYGYRCERLIASPNLNQMDKFTYWQCAEAWVKPGEGAPRQAAETLKLALETGVTVWSNPDTIGDVDQ